MKLKPYHLGLYAMLASQALSAADLTLAIDGYSSGTGYLMLSVYNNQEAFDSDNDALILLRQVPVEQGHSISFHDLPEGEYAIKAFHDENATGELDRNILGIPAENYGFSGKSRKRGPTSYEEARILLKEDTTIELNLR